MEVRARSASLIAVVAKRRRALSAPEPPVSFPVYALLCGSVRLERPRDCPLCHVFPLLTGVHLSRE